MTKFNFRYTLLLLAVAGLAASAQAWDVYYLETPGYFIGTVEWKSLGETPQYQWKTGESPSISPNTLKSFYSGDIQKYTFSSDCYHVETWGVYEQYLGKHRGDLDGTEKTVDVSFSTLNSICRSSSTYYFHLVPLLGINRYGLSYDANGGTWSKQSPADASYLWTNRVTVAAASVLSRSGYSQTGWNTAQDGNGKAVSAGAANCNGESFGVTNNNQDVVLYAQWQANNYTLRLRLGNGIDKIYYKARSSGEATSSSLQWKSTASDLDVSVAYDSEWQAYATAKPGYSYSETTEGNPKKEKMTTAGATFDPSATANTIKVRFDGNGATSTGEMPDYTTYIFDQGEELPKNKFERGYTVRFVSNGGTAVPDDVAKYAFTNWNDKADGSGSYTYVDKEVVTNPCDSTGADVKLFAQWDTNQLTAITLLASEKGGAVFTGWYSDYALTKYVGKGGDSYLPSEDTTLYAKWTTEIYTVTFRDGHKDAGEALIEEQQVAYNHSATPPTPPTHKYSNFTEWTGGDYTHVTGNMTIRAQYADKVYQVYYQSNYKDGSVEDSYTSTKCGPGESTDEITLKSAKSIGFSKLGYAFSGWDWDPDSVTPEWQANDTMTYKVIDNHPDAKLYAIWSPNSYTVKFDKGAEAATGSTPDQAFTYDQAQALTANGFSYAGQDFLGWAISSGDAAARRVTYADKQVVSNLTTEANGTVTLTAVWSNYHYVRFDRNGATNEAEMVLQTFSGAETNALSPNAYGKVGYTFAGWATNLADAAKLAVTYTNCQAAAFPDAQPNETNVLYAVWATNRYTIAFDPGNAPADTNHYFFGTMEPLTNCAYDTSITIKCGYTNYCSKGLLGWSKTKGSATAEYPVTGTSPATRGNPAPVSNLTAEPNATNTLYAVWDGVGELSTAVKLTNAVLVSVCQAGSKSDVYWSDVKDYTEEPGHPHCVALKQTSDTDQKGRWDLQMLVVGSGRLSYCWYWEPYCDAVTKFILIVDGQETTKLAPDTYWNMTNSVQIAGDGAHELIWRVDGGGISKKNKICLDDVSWTPGVEVTPGGEMPTYETQEAAEAAAKATTVSPPNDEVAQACAAAGVDYNAMFDVKAVPIEAVNGGAYTLAIQLKEAVSNEVQSALNEAETNLASVITNNPISVSVQMKAGLYYGLAATNEVEWLSLAVPASWVLGTGKGGQSVEAARPSETEAFYELRMAITRPE